MSKTISIVTGTGRSGTSLFIELLAYMGYTKLPRNYNKKVRGGYEVILDTDDDYDIYKLPRIIKDSRLLVSCEEVLNKNTDLKIDHAFLCIRDFETASKSREEANIIFSQWGSMNENYGETPHKSQVVFFQRAVGKFIETCSLRDIDVTIINYPRFAEDVDYLYRKLQSSPFKPDLDTIEHYIDLIVDVDLLRHKIG